MRLRGAVMFSIAFEASVLWTRAPPPKPPQADARTRTGDPFITNEVLYQLSYVGGVAPGRK